MFAALLGKIPFHYKVIAASVAFTFAFGLGFYTAEKWNSISVMRQQVIAANKRADDTEAILSNANKRAEISNQKNLSLRRNVNVFIDGLDKDLPLTKPKTGATACGPGHFRFSQRDVDGLRKLARQANGNARSAR